MGKTKKMLARVNITTGISDFQEIELSDIFNDPEKVQIISAVAYEGHLDLIYLYEQESAARTKDAKV